MSQNNLYKIVHILGSTLLGIASFFISGLIACIVILRFDNYILATIVAGGIGGFILGLFHWKHKMLGRMTFAGLIAVPIGLLGSFILVEGLVGGFGLLFPSIAAHSENTGIGDIIAIILMGIVFGVIFGAIVYGRKSIRLFSVVCGAVSIPFGFLVDAMNSGHWIKVWLGNMFIIFGKIDLNLLVIIISFGLGIGLSISLNNILHNKNDNSSI